MFVFSKVFLSVRELSQNNLKQEICVLNFTTSGQLLSSKSQSWLPGNNTSYSRNAIMAISQNDAYMKQEYNITQCNQ